jgi:DNA repair exonuclease SbcCD ATPase subunit
MSQTETLLLVVLGFSLAALIFLFVGRFLWSLALRLGARRMQRQVPSTLAELHTERDRLRTEYAKLSQKLGARLENVKMRMAEQMAEVTRNRNRVETLAGDLNDRDAAIAARERDIEGFKARLAEREAEALETQAMLTELRGEISQKETEIDELRSALSALNTELAARPFIVEPAPESAGGTPGAEERLKRRIDDLTAISQQIAESRASEATPDPVLQEKLVQAARETEDLEKELARLDAAWNTKLGDLDPNNASPEAPAQPRAVANVISLANRIKSLKKDIAG